jgi:hypothetical protein
MTAADESPTEIPLAARVPGVMDTLVDSLNRVGRAFGLDLGAADEREVTDVAATIALMLEHTPHGYDWITPLISALTALSNMPSVQCVPCAASLRHAQHEYGPCGCQPDDEGHHQFSCPLFGRHRQCDDSLLIP